MDDLYKVSVIIPIYNAKKTLKRSLDSVFSQVDLPDNLEEIVVVCVLNACSEEDAAEYKEIIKTAYHNSMPNDKFSCSIPSEPEKGIVPALNAGLKVASQFNSKYIFRQDADDLWHPTKMSKQLAFLESNPSVDILGTNINFVKPEIYEVTGQFSYPSKDKEIKESMLRCNNSIAHPTVAFRSSILKRVGGYDDTFPMAEDFNLWLRCIKWFNFANLPEALVDYTQSHNPNYNPLSPQIATSNAITALRYFGEK